jgi:hypothetical protein
MAVQFYADKDGAEVRRHKSEREQEFNAYSPQRTQRYAEEIQE